eukprot:11222505-Lingulodinium_polyedra.AAC.1
MSARVLTHDGRLLISTYKAKHGKLGNRLSKVVLVEDGVIDWMIVVSTESLVPTWTRRGCSTSVVALWISFVCECAEFMSVLLRLVLIQ